MKSFFTATCLLSFLATPVMAWPYFVEAFAQRHCQYLAIGIEWETAADMALREFYEQIKDYDTRVLSNAMFDACPDLNLKAFQEYQQREENN